FSLEAFEEVAGAVTDQDGIDLIESLCDKSLILPSDFAGTTRYRLLNPIRQFAAEQLEGLGCREEAELAHMTHFRSLSATAGSALTSGERQVAAFQADHDNLVASITRAIERGARGDALMMALGLHTYWEETGNLADASKLILSALDPGLAEPLSFQGACVLLAYAPMCGNLTHAFELADRLAPALEDDLPPKPYGRVRFALAFLHLARAELAPAVDLWSDAGRHLVGIDDHFARNALYNAAWASTYDLRFDQATSLLDEAFAIAPPRQRWFDDLAGVHRSLISITRGAGTLDELVEAAGAVDDHGLRYRLMLAAMDTTLGAFLLGAEEIAEGWWRRLLQASLDMGHVWSALYSVEFAAWSAVAAGDDLAASVRWGCVHDVASERGYGLPGLIGQEHDRRMATVSARDPGALVEGLELGSERNLHELVEDLIQSPS
ncbi:MAG: hypothetical protein ACRDU0_10790, partial [Mycobacterium sp.]